MTGAIYIGHDIYRHSSYGPKHPLAVPRVSVCTDLCRALGWLPDAAYREAAQADDAALSRFHDPAYLAALRRAEATGDPPHEDRARYRLGRDGNAIYPEMYRRPAISAGGVLLGAALTASGGIAHVPGGGTHHGRPDRAAGFCFLNDPVLGLLAWRDQGLARIVYLDTDAHHGDGVEDAFARDPAVLTISLHEADRWPRTGTAHAPGIRNFPLPADTNDSEYAFLLEHAVLPAIRAHRPQAILWQAGADALAEDPLARLALSNTVAMRLARVLPALAPRLMVLGGGGYNPWTTGRAWALIWGTLAARPIPARLPPAAEAVLRALRYDRAAGRDPPEHWFTTLRDPPRPGPIRPVFPRLLETCPA